MASQELRDLGRELNEWTHPIIADRVSEAYRTAVGDAQAARALCELHCRMWRNLQMLEHREALRNRREIVRMLQSVKQSEAMAEQIDRDILNEILECIFVRSHRSRHLATGQAMALMNIAGRLVELKHAA